MSEKLKELLADGQDTFDGYTRHINAHGLSKTLCEEIYFDAEQFLIRLAAIIEAGKSTAK